MYNRRMFKKLKIRYTNLKRTLNRLKIKVKSFQNINEHLEKLDVNESTKNLCKLLVKNDCYYNETDKVFAQTLFYKSPSTYKYLRDQLKLRLPSTTSIYKWSPIKFIAPGANQILINQLEKVFGKMKEHSKICILSFDEICIKKDLTVNINLDRVEGFCDDGRDRTPELATSALFFMIRGLVEDWKYVLSYILLNNSTKAPQLAEIIKNIIRIVNNQLKLNVVTCDQAATNIATFKCLGLNQEKPYFLVDDHKILAQYDPPHLIKSVRNAFLHNQIMHSDFGISDINVIRRIFEYDSIQKVKLMPKLTMSHLEPNNFQKMNVKRAAQILSNTVASAIRTTVKTIPQIFGDYLENVTPTIEFIQRFNDIFDCLNCRNFGSSAPYEKPLKIGNHVYNYLENSLIYLDKIKIISKNENYFKFINGLKMTINAHLILIKDLNIKYDIKYILTGRTSQDCLENFFSILRGKGGYNFMPSSFDIGVHFANIVVRKITLNSPFQNCIRDEATNVDLDWNSFKLDYENSLKMEENETGGNILCNETEDIIENMQIDILKDNAIVYYAGYCIFKRINCFICLKKLLNENDVSIEY